MESESRSAASQSAVPRAREAKTWEWRHGFYAHWRRHAVGVLRALHGHLVGWAGPPD